ncbi:MAG TPA: VTT domain-containing protein [Dehalococcoidales bacterium]|nr:VTT domain-containing protein [Dehalococcoidales bacterium]
MRKPGQIIKDTHKLVTNRKSQVHWVRLLLTAVFLLAASFGLSTLLNSLADNFDLHQMQFELLVYVSIFVISLLANVTIIMPVPFAMIIMMTASELYSPYLVALCGAAGGTIGEISGYYAGRWGRKIALPEGILSYSRIESWVKKHGSWAIILIALQPVIPFDVGGIIAGAARMPLYKFLPSLFIGKLVKYVIIVLLWVHLGISGELPGWVRFFMGR